MPATFARHHGLQGRIPRSATYEFETMTIKTFISDESGAVTVDWVVLTAALVGLGLAVMAVIGQGLEAQSETVNSQLSNGSIIRTAFVGSVADARDTACTDVGYCSDDLAAGALRALGSTEMAAVSNVDYGADFRSDNGYILGGTDGTEIGTLDGGGNFVAETDTDALAAYGAAVSASDAQNALIDAEKAARSN